MKPCSHFLLFEQRIIRVNDYCLTSSPREASKCNFPAILEIMTDKPTSRPTNKPTYRPTEGQTGRPGHREVTLPISNFQISGLPCQQTRTHIQIIYYFLQYMWFCIVLFWTCFAVKALKRNKKKISAALHGRRERRG